MSRELKRVPLDFDYPLGRVWHGYLPRFCHPDYDGGCECCRKFASIMGIPMVTYGNDINDSCPDWMKYYKLDPPAGEGYQLWGTTTEGEPRSPVFKTLEELAEWCAENDTVFADIRVSKEDWLKLFLGSEISIKL